MAFNAIFEFLRSNRFAWVSLFPWRGEGEEKTDLRNPWMLRRLREN
jgi:hypothetical protein